MSKILIVEDDSRWAEIIIDLCHYIFGKDISVSRAATLDEAYEKVESESFDLYFVDACVPGDTPNTIELVRDIRKSSKGFLVAVSSVDEYSDQLVEAGCDMKINKSSTFWKTAVGYRNHLAQAIGLSD